MCAQKLVSKAQSTAKMMTVCFEGNIGSGKTTSLNYLANKCSHVNVMQEPIDKWTNVKSINFLDLLYADIKRWGFAFEHYAQLTRLKVWERTPLMPNSVTLIERSIFSARYCFTENLYRNGSLSEIEYIVIDEWFKWMCRQNKCKIDLIVYLRSTPDVVYQRIKERAREGESRIPFDYLNELHKLHEKWLLGAAEGVEKPPVLTIDADLGYAQLYQQLDQHLNSILGKTFI